MIWQPGFSVVQETLAISHCKALTKRLLHKALTKCQPSGVCLPRIKQASILAEHSSWYASLLEISVKS